MHTTVSPSARRARRLGTLATAIGVVSALTLVSAPAHAADPGAHFQAIAATSFDANGDCPLSSTGDDSTDEQTIAATGTKKISLSKATSATATNTMDPTDTISVSAKATLAGTVAAKSGAFTSLALKGTMSASSSAKKGVDSDCEPEAAAMEGVSIEFTVKKTGWIKLTSSTGRGVISQVMLTGPTAGGAQLVGFGKSTQVVKRKVTPGLYLLGVQHQLADTSISAASGAPYSASSTSALSLVYSTTKP